MDDVLVLIGADIQTNDLMEQVEGDSVRSEVFGRVESVVRRGPRGHEARSGVYHPGGQLQW